MAEMYRCSGIIFSLFKTLFKFISSEIIVYSKIGYYFPSHQVYIGWLFSQHINSCSIILCVYLHNVSASFTRCKFCQLLHNVILVRSPDGDTDFDIVTVVLQGDTLAPYFFIICLHYVLRTSIDKIKENGFELTKKRSRRYPAKTITNAEKPMT